MNSGPAVPLRSWIALGGAMLGAFMAVLDIQITNSALPEILGGLGATIDEGSWIQTSYLVAEIVVIPLTGWLADIFGTKRYLLATTAAFLASSIACAGASSLGGLIVFRVIQGLAGGALIPLAFLLVLRLLPPASHPLGFGLFGMTATFAPAVGPTIGGWLTGNFGWPAIFYLNLLPGAVMIAALGWGLAAERPRLHLLRHGDWWGIATMVLGLGSLIVFLEEGNRHDWFDSAGITLLGLTAACALTAAAVIEWRSPQPFLNLRLLSRRNFLLGSLVGMAFGLAMYGAAYLLPVYLAQVQGYSAEQIGWTIMWSGAPQLVMMPVAAVMLRRVDARWLLAVGLAFFSTSCFTNALMTNLTAYDQLKVAQLLRAIGMPLTIVPLTALATGGLAASESGSASALFNMMRNLGGSIGIALLATQLDRRQQFHAGRLAESVSPFAAATQERLARLTAHFSELGADPVRASDQALAVVAAVLRREAIVMSFADCFLLVGLVMAAVILLTFLCQPAADADVAAH